MTTRNRMPPGRSGTGRLASPVWLVAVVAWAAVATVRAELLFSDSFRGAEGVALTVYDADYVEGRTGEASPTVLAKLATPGLGYAGLAAAGESVQIGLATVEYVGGETVIWTNEADCRDKTTRSAIYFSFLVRIAEPADLTEGSFVGLQLPYSASRKINVGVLNQQGTPRITCWRVGSSVPEGVDYKIGETVLVVGKIPAIADTGYQLPVVSLFVNPDLAGEPAQPTKSFPTYNAKDEQVNLTAVSLAVIRPSKPRARAVGLLDEVRLGTTWEDVVPRAKD